jgi:hypothetical protein
VNERLQHGTTFGFSLTPPVSEESPSIQTSGTLNNGGGAADFFVGEYQLGSTGSQPGP